jgi:hypothetical protein
MKLFPSRETFVDLDDNTQVLMSTVKIKSSTSDHVELPNAVDAKILSAASSTTDPNFYLFDATRTGGAGYAGGGTALAIDGATVGTEYIVVSSHAGGVNTYPGRSTPDAPK